MFFLNKDNVNSMLHFLGYLLENIKAKLIHCLTFFLVIFRELQLYVFCMPKVSKQSLHGEFNDLVSL